MATYGLNIAIDTAGLNKIYNAGQYVTLVRSVDSTVSGSTVAWISFQPFQLNVVSWQDVYQIYAAGTALQPGATIMMTSLTGSPVQLGYTYTLARGEFTQAYGGSPAAYTAANQQSSGMSLGLAQSAVVNGMVTVPPLTAVTLNVDQQASFTPSETVSVFLASYGRNGVVINAVPSNALTVELTAASPVASIGFDSSSGTFYLSGGSAALMAQADLALGRTP